jgi:hypothetical protein
MSEKRLWIAVLAVVTMLVVSAAAQDEKNEVSGVIGRDFISSQTITNASSFDPFLRYGHGLSIEGSYARRIIVTQIYSISGEVPVMYDHSEKLHAHDDVVPPNYSAFFVAPSIRANLFPTTCCSAAQTLGSLPRREFFNTVLDWTYVSCATLACGAKRATSGPASPIFLWLRPARAVSTITLSVAA